ncbi:MAG: hypothetical protein KGK30_02440 [Elusimicrobia bacterium]|nr:hypothetical protein [Elusimicrobiota bacterium]
MALPILQPSPLSAFDEILEQELDERSGRGRLRAARHNRMDDWFYGCHFVGDPVMPGCWGVDAVWQGLALLAAGLGLKGCDKPLAMEEVRFFGQIRPHDRIVDYSIELSEVERSGGDAMVSGRAQVSVDGAPLYSIGLARLGTAFWEAPASPPAAATASVPQAPAQAEASRPLGFEEFLHRDHFSSAEIVALSLGRLVAKPPIELGLLPAAPMLQVGQVERISFNPASGEGLIAASLPNGPRDWFYPMSPSGKPAALSIDGVWQLMGLFLAWRGQPGTGRALGFERVEIFDAVVASDRLVRYEVRVLKSGPSGGGGAFVHADADVFADGRPILRCVNASVACHPGIRYSNYPFAQEAS